MTVPSPDNSETVDADLVELERTVELAVLDERLRRLQATAGGIALGAAALLFSVLLPWTDPNARWPGSAVMPGGRSRVIGLGVVIAVAVVAGILRPGLVRRAAGGLIALASLAATAAAGTALSGATIMSPGPTVALVVAPCLAVAAAAWIMERPPAGRGHQ
jgi:hypothetical protein